MSLDDIDISFDPTRIDVDLVHGFLTDSYWAAGRSRAVVERAVHNSLCVGAYHANRQIGFARAITDRAVFAYLADVFVLPPYRGRGVARNLVRALTEHEDLSGLPIMLLRTRDAHGLYRRFGFVDLPRPQEMMGRYR